MNDLLLQSAFALLIIAMLFGVVRFTIGPTVVDRILAFDAIVMCAVGLVVLLSRMWESPLYLDLILIVSSLGFFSTVALVFYLERTLVPDGGPEPEEEEQT